MIVEITATLELDHSHVVEKFVMYMPQIETDQRRKDDIVKPHGLLSQVCYPEFIQPVRREWKTFWCVGLVTLRKRL